MKGKNIKIIWLFLLSVYLFFFIFAKEIEALISFPGVFINTLKYSKNYSENIQLDFKKIDIVIEWKSIQGLWIDNNASKTVYYFHWSWWDLSFFYDDIEKISSLEVNVMAIEYPWYGSNKGFPYTEEILLCSGYFLEHMMNQYNIDQKDIVLLGYSVGTGIALEFAQKADFEKIILLSAYTSRYDLMRADIWFSWQKYVFYPEIFNAQGIIKNLNSQILILHWEKDEVINKKQSRDLYQASNMEKNSLIVLPEWNHYNLLEKQETLDQIQQFIWK